MEIPNNLNPLPFFPIVEKLNRICQGDGGVLSCIDQLDESEYKEIRQAIIETFEIGPLAEYSGDFDSDDVELGDIADWFIEVTTTTYKPENTPMDKPISREDRLTWCTKIIDGIDNSVSL